MNYVVALLRILVASTALYVVYYVTIVEGYWGQIEKFTLQSMVLVGVTMVWGAWSVLAERALPPAWLEGGVLAYVVGAGLVYQFLANDGGAVPELAFGLTYLSLMHYVVPAGAFIIWLLLTPHRAIEWQWALWWLAYLGAYLVLFIGRGLLYDEAGYPYDFMNPDVHGWDQTGVNYLAAFGVTVIGGAIVIAIDRTLPERTPLSAGRHDL